MNFKINIKTMGVDSTPALMEFVNSKLSSMEHLLAGQDEVLAEVEIGKTTAHHKSGEIFKAAINLSANSKRFRVEETAEDLYAAIDLAKDELFKQIRDKQDKEHTRFIRGARKLKNIIRGWKPWH